MAKKEDKKVKAEAVLALKDMTVAELSAKNNQLYAAISKKRLEKTIGRLKNTREIFNLGKERARVKTIISVKSKGQT